MDLRIIKNPPRIYALVNGVEVPVVETDLGWMTVQGHPVDEYHVSAAIAVHQQTIVADLLYALGGQL